jgi:adenylylsulfate kinase
MREELNGHRGATLWFTGLSGAGKSTLANEVALALHRRGVRTYVMDGDNIRQGLNRGLSFSTEDRKENIRRIAEVARLFTDAGLVNLTAFISPFRDDRAAARALQPEPNHFLEVYVEADVETCAARDPKGLYKKALAGEITGFTGVSKDAPYEAPLAAEIVANTSRFSLAQCTALVLAELERRGIIPAIIESNSPSE